MADKKANSLNENSSIEDIREYVNYIMQKKEISPTDNTKAEEFNDRYSTEIEEFDKLKTKVLKYIVYKKRTEKEVRTKFSSSDVNQDMLEDVIEDLKANNYINDNNYIERAMNEFIAINTLSLKEIKNKLYAKGISNDIIEKYFSDNEETLGEYEQKCARKIAIKKQSQMDIQDIEAFLYRKGYSRESIKQAFEE